MNFSYMLYQAEHVKTAGQQREDDIRAGELAAELGRLWQSLAHPRNRGGRRGFLQAPEIEMLSEACAACSGPSTGQQAICG
jgi:hypothetical protein